MQIIAETGPTFADFGPYVPSINNAGQVAYEATLTDGATAVYVDDHLIAGAEFGKIVSHPDINDKGDLCFFAEQDGHTRLIQISNGETTSSAFEAGPLGPTMNEAGDVAYRGFSPTGEAAILSTRLGIVAVAGEKYREFHGLPLMSEEGRVAFRADLLDGSPGIFWDTGEQVAEGLDEIGRFPCLAGSGIAYVARRGNDWGIYCDKDRVEGPEFASYRGLLANGSGVVVFFATPPGGVLGVYRPGSKQPVLEMNGPLFGSTVVDFALNPVSVNDRGDAVVRIKLENGRHVITRVP